MNRDLAGLTRTQPRLIRATVWTFGAGPGMGGASYIEYKLQGRVYQVFGGGDAGDLTRDHLGQVPVAKGWRGRLSFLLDNAPPAHEDYGPSEVVVRGGLALEKVMLALAWSGPDGGNVARALLGLSDQNLSLLAKNDMVSESAIETFAALNDDDVTYKDILSTINKAIAAGHFDWDMISRSARALSASKEAARKAKRDGFNARLESHKPLLVKVMAAWESQQRPASSQASGWLLAARRKTVRSFLESQLVENGKLPTGIQGVDFRFMGNEGVMQLDMDTLTEPL